MGNPYLPAMRKNRSLWEKNTIKAFQWWAQNMRSYYSRSYLIDGDFGIQSRKAAQRWMKAYGNYSRAIDGDFGPYSLDGLRRTLDQLVNFSFTVTLPNGTKQTYSGKLPKISSFPQKDYVLKWQTYLDKQG